MSVQSDYSKNQLDSSTKKGKEDVYWDDLQVAISNVRIPPANAPTWRDYAYGVAAGVTFPVLGFAVGNYIFFDLQTAHSMQLNTTLEGHFHFNTPTDGTGDNINFQLDVIYAPVFGTWTVPTGFPATAEHTILSDYSDQHIIFDEGTIPAVNTTVSTLYKFKLTRIAATANEYAGEVYINFIDSHFRKDRDGSELEYSKEA